MLYTSRWNTNDSLEVIHDPSLIRNMAMGGNVWQVRKCLNHQSSENMKPALDKLRTYLVPNILCDIYRVYVLVSDRQNTQRYSSVLWLGLAESTRSRIAFPLARKRIQATSLGRSRTRTRLPRYAPGFHVKSYLVTMHLRRLRCE